MMDNDEPEKSRVNESTFPIAPSDSRNKSR